MSRQFSLGVGLDKGIAFGQWEYCAWNNGAIATNDIACANFTGAKPRRRSCLS